jgi:hypothetical protein
MCGCRRPGLQVHVAILQRGSLQHIWQHHRVHECSHRQPSPAHLHLLHQQHRWHIIHLTTTTRTHHLCTSLPHITLHTPTTCPLSIPHTPLQIKGELHLKSPIPACPFTVKLRIRLYLIHFFRNDLNFLLELESSLVINRLYKRNCGKRTRTEQTSVESQKPRERKRIFFLSLCHKTRPL